MKYTGAPLRVSRRPPRIAAGPFAAVVLTAALAGIGIGFGVQRLLEQPGPTIISSRNGLDGEATWAPGVRPAPPITSLRDKSGKKFSLASLRGHTIAIVFFDSYCKQQCPLEGRDLAQAERTIPRAARPVLVAVSVDPLDTASSVRTAVREWGLSSLAGWHWLMGTHSQLASVWRAYHIYVGSPVGGDIPHTEAVYLVDRRGYERSAYMYPFAPAFVTHDLAVLSHGSRS